MSDQADQAFAAKKVIVAAEQLTLAAKMMDDQSTPGPITRSALLRRIQDRLGDGKVSSEMRAFCELCEKEYLEPLETKSKDELLTLSDNSKKAIGQSQY